MPNVELFNYLFVVQSGFPPGNLTIGSPITFPVFVQESALDGSLNNSTDFGQAITFAGATSTLLGLTGNGEPICAYNQPPPGPYTNIQIASNNPALGPLIFVFMDGPYLYCFGQDTEIATPDGGVAVQDLAIGDPIKTATGAVSKVKWLGKQTVKKLFSANKMQPVRIRAGALGAGLPHKDLTVTADHGMIIDGLVINASALVNHTTIDYVPLAELPNHVTYYHVETENHDVILANGAPAETFIDYADRRSFDNYQEYVDLYGVERIITEMDRPRISSARLVPDAIKARLGISLLVNEDLEHLSA